MFGRSPAVVWAALWRLPQFLSAAVECTRVFRQPARVLAAYVRRRNPPDRRVELRDGTVLHLTDDDADIVTVFLVFCRMDYGRVEPGSRVIDIGANIGVFAVFAARCGASEVHAYEPTAESLACLQRNIVDNGLDGVIHAVRAAVTGAPSGPVWFPRRSSVLNTLSAERPSAADSDQVPTVTLAGVLASFPTVDLIKMDCEGAEFDIFRHTAPAAFSGVRAVRLEFHRGPREELLAAIDQLGYRRVFEVDEGHEGGQLWLVR